MSKYNAITTDTVYPSNQAVYTAAGLNKFVVPPNVNSICVCVLGGGGAGGASYGAGGGGGGLAYVNNLSVIPGTVYNINVGVGGSNNNISGSNSWFSNATFLYATNGLNGTAGNGQTAGGGGGAAGYSGNGGIGGYAPGGTQYAGGAGGAGGGTASGIVAYSGGNGGNASSIQVNTLAATTGSGGAGAGGFGSFSGGAGGGGIWYTGQSSVDYFGNTTTAGPGVLSTTGGPYPFTEYYFGSGVYGYGTPNGGSGGTSGVLFEINNQQNAGFFGGGNGGARNAGSTRGANGFVYIAWGSGRSFPTANLNLIF